MLRPSVVIAAAALLVCALVPPSPARAAQSYDACTGFIDAVPATIATQGVWCLRRDLSTAISTGAVITVATNNVTLDCNGFKLGGLAAGVASQAHGIHAVERQNLTVRNCTIRGFYIGIRTQGYDIGGHLVQDNRLDNNLYMGLWLQGTRNRARGNAVYDTGGAPNASNAYGMLVGGDVIDNVVDGVFATAAAPYTVGILADAGDNVGSVVRDNQVRRVMAGGGTATGIYGGAPSSHIVGNQITAVAYPPTNGPAIYGWGGRVQCIGNTITNFTVPLDSCAVSADNHAFPQ